MKTRVLPPRPSWFLTLAVLALGTSVVGCVQTDEAQSVVLLANAVVTQQEQCIARPNPRAYRSLGVMDTWMTNRYVYFGVVENSMPSTAGMPMYNEVNVLQFMGYRVTYTYPDGLDAATKDVLAKEYYVPTTGFAHPQERGVAIADIIPPEVGNALAQDPNARNGFQILVKLRLESRQADGRVLHSNEITFPLDICWHCLYMQVTEDCTDLSDAQDMRPPCLIGQDEGVDCRLFTLWGMN